MLSNLKAMLFSCQCVISHEDTYVGRSLKLPAMSEKQHVSLIVLMNLVNSKINLSNYPIDCIQVTYISDHTSRSSSEAQGSQFVIVSGGFIHLSIIVDV